MKRYISLICVALTLVLCMASPVSAVEVDSYIQVLDYATANDSSNFVPLSSGSNTITFDLGFSILPNYVDIVAKIESVPSAVYYTVNGRDYQLNVINVTSNIYRIYGNVSLWDTTSLSIKVVTGSLNWIDFHSFRADLFASTFTDTVAQGVVDYANESQQFILDSSVSTPAYVNIYYNGEFEFREFYCYVSSSKWKSFDFLDLQLLVSVSDINSLSCMMGPINVPFDVSYLAASATDDLYYVTIRMDFRNLNRTSTDYPQVIITGNLRYDAISTFRIMNASGVIVSESADFDSYWFRRIINSVGDFISTQTQSISSYFSVQTNAISGFFNNLVSKLNIFIVDQTVSLNSTLNSILTKVDDFKDLYYEWVQYVIGEVRIAADQLEAAIRGDTSPGDSFQDEVDQKDQQLNDMAAVMDSVDRPELDSVNVSADTYIDTTVLTASTQGLTAVIGAPVFLDVIMMSLIMATCGYVLFGKR